MYDFSACRAQLTETGPGGVTAEDMLWSENEHGYPVGWDGPSDVYEALGLSSAVRDLLGCGRCSYYGSSVLLRFNSSD